MRARLPWRSMIPIRRRALFLSGALLIMPASLLAQDDAAIPADNNPLIIDLEVKLQITVRPNSTSENKSAARNCNATLASRGHLPTGPVVSSQRTSSSRLN